MNMKNFCGQLAIVLVVFGWAGATSAQSMLTNGYVCGPKNIGGEDTRRFYREQDGNAVNISPTSTFPVTCPVIIFFGEPAPTIMLRLVNTGNTTQQFLCALEEYDLNTNLVRTIGRSQNVPAGLGDSIIWDNISFLDPRNFLSVRCILPPKGAIGEIGWFDNRP